MTARPFALLPVIMLALILSVPTLSIFAAWFFPAGRGFSYLLEKGLLEDYTQNSLIIAFFTGMLALMIGTLTAWVVTMRDFPAKRFLSWALILPFAMPAYVAAMVYGYLLEGAGPVQSAIRDISGLAFGEYSFPNVRSLGGTVFILTVTLYPYSYLMARGAFIMQSRQMLEAGEMLGLSRWQQLTRLALPLARPALIVGLALVVMETLADYGVVSLYGVPTFTTGIYRLWQGFYDPVAAARLASVLLLFVLAALWLEKRVRGKAQYYNSALFNPITCVALSKTRGYVVALLCFTPVLLGFVVPLCVLIVFSFSHVDVFFESATWQATLNALKVAFLTAGVAVVIGLVFAYCLRGGPGSLVNGAIRIATAGYAIPGAIIAIGTLLFLITLQNDVLDGDVFLTGTLFGVVWACVIRFLTISFNATEAELTRITPAMDDAATMLGSSRLHILRHIHMPILKATLLIGFLLVFIDTLKELPATLLLRPFNFDTLAIRTYELARDDLLPHASVTAILLVVISLVPIWILKRKITNTRLMESYD